MSQNTLSSEMSLSYESIWASMPPTVFEAQLQGLRHWLLIILSTFDDSEKFIAEILPQNSNILLTVIVSVSILAILIALSGQSLDPTIEILEDRNRIIEDIRQQLDTMTIQKENLEEIQNAVLQDIEFCINHFQASRIDENPSMGKLFSTDQTATDDAPFNEIDTPRNLSSLRDELIRRAKFYDSELRNLRDDLDASYHENNYLEDVVTNLKGEREILQNCIQKFQAENEALNKQSIFLESNLASLKTAFDFLDVQRVGLVEQVDVKTKDARTLRSLVLSLEEELSELTADCSGAKVLYVSIETQKNDLQILFDQQAEDLAAMRQERAVLLVDMESLRAELSNIQEWNQRLSNGVNNQSQTVSQLISENSSLRTSVESSQVEMLALQDANHTLASEVAVVRNSLLEYTALAKDLDAEKNGLISELDSVRSNLLSICAERDNTELLLVSVRSAFELKIAHLNEAHEEKTHLTNLLNEKEKILLRSQEEGSLLRDELTAAALIQNRLLEEKENADNLYSRLKVDFAQLTQQLATDKQAIHEINERLHSVETERQEKTKYVEDLSRQAVLSELDAQRLREALGLKEKLNCDLEAIIASLKSDIDDRDSRITILFDEKDASSIVMADLQEQVLSTSDALRQGKEEIMEASLAIQRRDRQVERLISNIKKVRQEIATKTATISELQKDNTALEAKGKALVELIESQELLTTKVQNETAAVMHQLDLCRQELTNLEATKSQLLEEASKKLQVQSDLLSEKDCLNKDLNTLTEEMALLKVQCGTVSEELQQAKEELSRRDKKVIELRNEVELSSKQLSEEQLLAKELQASNAAAAKVLETNSFDLTQSDEQLKSAVREIRKLEADLDSKNSQLMSSRTKTNEYEIEIRSLQLTNAKLIEDIKIADGDKITIGNNMKLLNLELQANKETISQLECRLQSLKSDYLSQSDRLANLLAEKQAVEHSNRVLDSRLGALSLDIVNMSETISSTTLENKRQEKEIEVLKSEASNLRLVNFNLKNEIVVLNESMAQRMGSIGREHESLMTEILATKTRVSTESIEHVERLNNLSMEKIKLQDELQSVKSELSMSTTMNHRLESETSSLHSLLSKTTDEKNCLFKEREALKADIKLLHQEIQRNKDTIEQLTQAKEGEELSSASIILSAEQRLMELEEANRRLEMQSDVLTQQLREVEAREVAAQAAAAALSVQIQEEHNLIVTMLQEELQINRDTIQRLEARLEGLDQTSSTKSEQLANLLVEERNAMERHAQSETQLEEVNKELSRSICLLEAAEAAKNSLHVDSIRLMKEVDELRATNRLLSDERESLVKKVAEFDLLLEQLSHSGHASLEEVQSILTSRELELVDLQSSMKAAVEERLRQQKEIEHFRVSLDQSLSEAVRIAQEKTSLEMVVNDLTARLNIQEEERRSLLETHNQLVISTNDLNDELTSRSVALENLESKYADVSSSHAELKSSLAALQEEASLYSQSIANLEAQTQPLQAHIKALGIQIKEKDEVIARFESFDVEVERNLLVMEKQDLLGKIDFINEQLNNSKAINIQLRQQQESVQADLDAHCREKNTLFEQREALYADIHALKGQYDSFLETQNKAMTDSFTVQAATMKIGNEELRRQVDSYRSQVGDATARITELEIDNRKLQEAVKILREQNTMLMYKKPLRDEAGFHDVFFGSDLSPIAEENPIYAAGQQVADVASVAATKGGLLEAPPLTPQQQLRNELNSLNHTKDALRRDLIALQLEYGLESPSDATREDTKTQDENGDNNTGTKESAGTISSAEADFGVPSPVTNEGSVSGSPSKKNSSSFSLSMPRRASAPTASATSSSLDALQGNNLKAGGNKNMISKLYNFMKTDIKQELQNFVPKGLLKKGKKMKKRTDLPLRVIDLNISDADVVGSQGSASKDEARDSVEKRFFNDVFNEEGEDEEDDSVDEEIEVEMDVDQSEIIRDDENDAAFFDHIVTPRKLMGNFSGNDDGQLDSTFNSSAPVRRSSLHLNSQKIKHPFLVSPKHFSKPRDGSLSPSKKREPLQSLGTNSQHQSLPAAMKPSYIAKAITKSSIAPPPHTAAPTSYLALHGNRNK